MWLKATPKRVVLRRLESFFLRSSFLAVPLSGDTDFGTDASITILARSLIVRYYKSAAIRPSTLEKLIIDYKIKPVIDLRNEVSDRYHQEEIAAAVGKIEGTRYVNIRSPQVPNRQHLIQFLEVLDQPDRYPVLIHCYHGLGRTMLSSAIYRMEYENMSNSEARGQTRFIVESPAYRSSFAAHETKGAFLINSKPRQVGRFATVNMMS